MKEDTINQLENSEKGSGGAMTKERLPDSDGGECR